MNIDTFLTQPMPDPKTGKYGDKNIIFFERPHGTGFYMSGSGTGWNVNTGLPASVVLGPINLSRGSAIELHDWMVGNESRFGHPNERDTARIAKYLQRFIKGSFNEDF